MVKKPKAGAKPAPGEELRAFWVALQEVETSLDCLAAYHATGLPKSQSESDRQRHLATVEACRDRVRDSAANGVDVETRGAISAEWLCGVIALIDRAAVIARRLAGPPLYPRWDPADDIHESQLIAEQLRMVEAKAYAAFPFVTEIERANKTPTEVINADNWPPDDGWHFRPGQYAYKRVVFDLTGAERRLLEKLAANQGRRFMLAELRDAVSGDDSPTLASSIRPLLTKLRHVLRHNHRLVADADPIPHKGKGDDAVWWFDVECCARHEPQPKKKKNNGKTTGG